MQDHILYYMKTYKETISMIKVLITEESSACVSQIMSELKTSISNQSETQAVGLETQMS